MKKRILFLSMSLMAIVFLSCNTNVKTNQELVGKWQNAKIDTVSYVLEITENNEWNYSKNEELLEKGAFEVQENIFIMKHVVEEHDHAHEGDSHSHAHPEDHKYEFKLNEDKSELSFTSEGKTSVFKKIN